MKLILKGYLKVENHETMAEELLPPGTYELERVQNPSNPDAGIPYLVIKGTVKGKPEPSFWFLTDVCPEAVVLIDNEPVPV